MFTDLTWLLPTVDAFVSYHWFYGVFFPSKFFPFGFGAVPMLSVCLDVCLDISPFIPLTNHSWSMTWLELNWILVIG